MWHRHVKRVGVVASSGGSRFRVGQHFVPCLAGGCAAALLAGGCEQTSVSEQGREEVVGVLHASSKPSRAQDSGVRIEYRREPRVIKPLDPPKLGFFSKEIDTLGVPIRAHASVSDAALIVAADRLSRMLRNLPNQIIDRLVRRGASFHIIGACATQMPAACCLLPSLLEFRSRVGGPG